MTVFSQTHNRISLCLSYLIAVTSVFGHHLSKSLQNFNAQLFLIFFQQLLGVFDQPENTQKVFNLLSSEE